MSQYTNLLATINAQIKANGVGAITGPLLNAVLRQMVSVLGDGYRLVGVAAPGDNPGTPDNQVAYLAGQDGTYTNFGGITLSGEVALLVWGASWSKQSLFSIDSAVTPGSGNPVSSDAVGAALAALAGEYQKLVPRAEEGHLAEFDGAGQVRDAGVSLDELPANFAACLYDRRSAGTPQSPYTFRQSGGDGVNYLKSIKGRTLVWNQLVQNGNLSDGIADWAAYRATVTLSDGVAKITPTAADNFAGFASPAGTLKWIEGHKYLFFALVKGTSGIELSFSAYYGGLAAPIRITASGNWEQLSGIVTAGSTMAGYAALRVEVVQAADANLDAFYVRSVFCVDLTLLGWVPSSVSEFRAVYRLPYFAYTPALLINNAATALESTGFNQWDEELEEGILNADGTVTPTSGRYCSKNYIPCGLASKYYFNLEGSANFNTICYYDANFALVGYEQSRKGERTIPSGAVWAKFGLYSSYAGENICINISDASRNGTYEPYWKATRHLGLDSIQAKEVGSDTIVTINGLDGVGDNVDLLKDGKTLIKNRARVDLGSLTWVLRSGSSHTFDTSTDTSGITNSILKPATAETPKVASSRYTPASRSAQELDTIDKSIGVTTTGYLVITDTAYTDPAAFKTAMAGVMLDYPVATPKEYELVEPIQPMLEVDELGTEKRLPEDTAAAVNAPFESDSNYSVSVANLVRKLSE